MGNGAWSASNFFEKAASRARSGTDTFDYSARAVRSGNLRVHQTLDPQGLEIRQSRDSQEHPDSNAILISLDVTGSMGRVVRAIHRDLPHLHELLLGQKFLPDPQVLFAAIGDATCDRVPLQVGQFESDNRMDQNLENMILEGGGGGQKTESYELTLYVAARHTAIDCWEKRRRKGYLFMIGDEKAYPTVSRAQVRQLIGADPQADISLAQIIAEVQEKYHLYFIIPGGASHGADKDILGFWQQAVGVDNVIQLAEPDETSESIAMTIGLHEGAITLDQARQTLSKRGKVAAAIDRLLKSIGGIFGAEPGTKPGKRYL